MEKTLQNRQAYYIMIVGLFMAILDIQIVASSIGEIQAALSISFDEVSWVQTAYLIAEVVMIPICGWLSEVFSTRLLFVVSAGMFTLASAACAWSWNLESMIVCRVIQGFFGGAMIPTVFSSIFIIFPKAEQTKATITAGLVATVAPTLGPTIGGWLTTNFSWHWLFLVNIIPGCIVTYGVFKKLHIDKPQRHLLKKFDFYGFLYIALGLGFLELLLKKGNKYDWFDSTFILLLLMAVIIAFLALVYRELTTEAPIIDIRAFRDSNFTVGCFLSFTVGVGLFGAVYLLPVLLTMVKHYSSLQIGIVMFVAGLFQFASGPIAGMLEKKIDLRLMLFIGLSLFGLGTLMNGFMTTDVDFHELFWPQAIRGISIMLCFLPMTAVTLSRLPQHEIKNASGLYNLMRNLGGAIGIAVIETYLTNRIRIHKANLSEFINSQKLNQLGEGGAANLLENYFVDASRLEAVNLKLLSGRIEHQSTILAFNDVFFYVGLYLLVCCLFILLVKPVEHTEEISAH